MQFPTVLETVSREFPDEARRFVSATVDMHKYLPLNLMSLEDRVKSKSPALLRSHKSSFWIELQTEHTPLHMIFHEVLHLRRFSQQEAPWVTTNDVDHGWIGEKLVNDLEHRHVVPQEIFHFPEARAYWCRTLRTVLDDATKSPRGYKIQRFNLVMAWLVVRSAFKGDLLGDYEAELARQGFSEFSKALADCLEQRANEPIEQIGCCISMFEFDSARFHIMTYTQLRMKMEVPKC